MDFEAILRMAKGGTVSGRAPIIITASDMDARSGDVFAVADSEKRILAETQRLADREQAARAERGREALDEMNKDDVDGLLGEIRKDVLRYCKYRRLGAAKGASKRAVARKDAAATAAAGDVAEDTAIGEGIGTKAHRAPGAMAFVSQGTRAMAGKSRMPQDTAPPVREISPAERAAQRADAGAAQVDPSKSTDEQVKQQIIKAAATLDTMATGMSAEKQRNIGSAKRLIDLVMKSRGEEDSEAGIRALMPKSTDRNQMLAHGLAHLAVAKAHGHDVARRHFSSEWGVHESMELEGEVVAEAAPKTMDSGYDMSAYPLKQGVSKAAAKMIHAKIRAGVPADPIGEGEIDEGVFSKVVAGGKGLLGKMGVGPHKPGAAVAVGGKPARIVSPGVFNTTVQTADPRRKNYVQSGDVPADAIESVAADDENIVGEAVAKTMDSGYDMSEYPLKQGVSKAAAKMILAKKRGITSGTVAETADGATSMKNVAFCPNCKTYQSRGKLTLRADDTDFTCKDQAACKDREDSGSGARPGVHDESKHGWPTNPYTDAFSGHVQDGICWQSGLKAPCGCFACNAAAKRGIEAVKKADQEKTERKKPTPEKLTPEEKRNEWLEIALGESEAKPGEQQCEFDPCGVKCKRKASHIADLGHGLKIPTCSKHINDWKDDVKKTPIVAKEPAGVTAEATGSPSRYVGPAAVPSFAGKPAPQQAAPTNAPVVGQPRDVIRAAAPEPPVKVPPPPPRPTPVNGQNKPVMADVFSDALSGFNSTVIVAEAHKPTHQTLPYGGKPTVVKHPFLARLKK